MTGGSLTRKDVKADKDSVVVQRLKEAGLIPLLVSSTPEYYGSIETYNKLIGYTYNPYNTLYTCGGSSGGEVNIDIFRIYFQNVLIILSN